MLKGSTGTSKGLGGYNVYNDDFIKATHIDIVFYCENGHETTHAFAADLLDKVPQVWECEKCGLPAGIDKNNIPKKKKGRTYKTHWQYLLERRTLAFGERLLKQRLKILNGK